MVHPVKNPTAASSDANASELWAKHGHTWKYCGLCEVDMVVCGKCGNNCCNATYGSVNGIECDACPSAYDMQDAGKQS